MDLLMNGLLMAATLFAGGYCWVLGRRVQDLKSLDRGLGGSIVTLTRQIELARATLDEARGASKETRQELAQLIGKADAAANQLKMLIAAAPIYPPAAPAPASPPVPEAPVVRAPAPSASPEERVGARSLSFPELPDLATLIRAAEPAAPPAAATEAEPSPAPGAPAMNLAEVPKPRALVPVENPLRRARGAGAGAKPAAEEQSETAILAALTALAGGGR